MPVQRVESGERWFKLLEYFEEAGGQVERRIEDLVKDLDIPQRSLDRHLRRMEELGVLDIRRERGAFGEGRLPNIYRLRIGPTEWRERGDIIVEQHKKRGRRDQRRTKAQEKRAEKKETARIYSAPPQDVVDKVRHAVAEELRVDVDETDAWLAGETVEID